MNQAKRTAALVAAAFLAGCAGGGGSGGGSSTGGGTPYRPPPADTPCGVEVCIPYLPRFPGDPGYVDPYAPTVTAPVVPPWGPIFRSWTELPPLVSAQFDAIAGSLSYKQRHQEFDPYGYISATESSLSQRQTSLLEGPKYDSNGELNFVPSVFSNRGTAFSRTDPDSGFATLAAVGQPGIDLVWQRWPWSGMNTFTGKIADEIAVVANPSVLGWNYQSFGIWDGYDLGPGRIVDLRSYGAATPANAIPATGSATFSGKLAGLYVSPGGYPGGGGSIATAELAVNVNFSTRTLGFASTGTATTRDFQTRTAAPNLNLNGTLSYSPGSNSFSGTLTNAGGTMSGSSKGQFYGPAAQELGGVFTLKSPSTVETFAGAYGAKR